MLVFLLTAGLRKQAYSIFVTDQRLWIPDRNLYTYPDVMVTPRPADLRPDRKDIEQYVKQTENQWLFTEYQSLEVSFTLASVPVAIALTDLYEVIDL